MMTWLMRLFGIKPKTVVQEIERQKELVNYVPGTYPTNDNKEKGQEENDDE